MKKLVNISIDDISPHPRSSIKVLERCFELIETFPDIKFSLFIPMAYWRTMRPGTTSKYSFQINVHESFCNTLKALPEENFEICYHGLFHGIPGLSDVDEFKFLNYNQSIEKFKAMFDVAKEAGLFQKFKMIFRPPAWQMTPAGMKAGYDLGIKLYALSPKERHQVTYAGEDKNYNCVYYNVNPPYDELRLFEKTEMVYHATEWDKNYLSHENKASLENFLIENKESVDFCFLEKMI